MAISLPSAKRRRLISEDSFAISLSSPSKRPQLPSLPLACWEEYISITYIHVYMYIHVNAHMYVHIYIYIYVHTYIHICIYIYVQIYIHTCIHTYICVCFYIYINIHVFKYFYSAAHTHDFFYSQFEKKYIHHIQICMCKGIPMYWNTGIFV